jgi:hypothetical protein
MVRVNDIYPFFSVIQTRREVSDNLIEEVSLEGHLLRRAMFERLLLL